MRDSRRSRAALVLAISAAIGAVLGELYVKPALDRMVKR